MNIILLCYASKQAPHVKISAEKASTGFHLCMVQNKSKHLLPATYHQQHCQHCLVFFLYFVFVGNFLEGEREEREKKSTDNGKEGEK